MSSSPDDSAKPAGESLAGVEHISLVAEAAAALAQRLADNIETIAAYDRASSNWLAELASSAQGVAGDARQAADAASGAPETVDCVVPQEEPRTIAAELDRATRCLGEIQTALDSLVQIYGVVCAAMADAAAIAEEHHLSLSTDSGSALSEQLASVARALAQASGRTTGR